MAWRESNPSSFKSARSSGRHTCPGPAPTAYLFSSSARSFDFDPSKPDYKKTVANLWAVRRLAVGMVHRWFKAQGSQEASGPGKDSAAERFSGDKSSEKKAPRSQI